MDWIKLSTYGILRGSIVAQLSLEEQAIWVKLLAFAGEQRDRGIIRRSKGIPYSMADLASQLTVPEYLLISTIEKCTEDGNAEDPSLTRIMILDDGSILIGNWAKYQNRPLTDANKKVSPLPEAIRKQIARRYANQYPGVVIDVIQNDFGFSVVDKKTGEILEK